MVVYRDRLDFGLSLKWPFKEVQFCSDGFIFQPCESAVTIFGNQVSNDTVFA